MDSQPPAPLVARPYRSHKVPACDRCRSRKIRCDIDLSDRPCRFCRDRNETCEFTQKGRSTEPSPRRPVKRQRQNHDMSSRLPSQSGTSETLRLLPDASNTSPTESSLMMNPPMSEDIAILEQYLTSQTAEGGASTRPYNTISNTPGNPIVYLSVPRRRKGLRTAIDPGKTQREIIEQVLHPFADEVRNLYFEHLHLCFPILDETTFFDMWHKDNDRISSTLMCDLYASALLFWEKSQALRHHVRPDMQFIWNQAVSALQEDFMEPKISTVHAALLDMVGRPVLSVTGNIVNAGRIVTLAHSLGLHRDPTLWKATAHEKKVRIKLWWGVLINDYWSSIGHGIPPTINRSCYDVPVPTLELLVTSEASETTLRATSTFVHLCKLSQILGDILPLVYSLQLDVEHIWRNLRKIKCALDEWTEVLPVYLHLSTATASSVDGASNLWFAYLSIKVLICRLAYKATLKDPRQNGSEARQYRLATLREAAIEVTDFTASLSENQLRDFWMPYTSYLLVSAATVLLRCTIECGDIATKRLCTTKLVNFRDRLQQARTVSGWDLADFCLDRCNEPIQKMANALHITQTDRRSSQTSPTTAALVEAPPVFPEREGDAFADPAMISDIFNSLDFPWETMWDVYEET